MLDNNLCGKQTIHLQSKETGEHVLRAMTCNKIECPNCNPMIVSRINQRVRYHASQERLYFFNTITSKAGIEDLDDLFTKIRKEMTYNGTIEGYMKRKKVSREKAEQWYQKRKEKMIQFDVDIELQKIARYEAIIYVAKRKKVHYRSRGMDAKLAFRKDHKIFISKTYNTLLREKRQDVELINGIRSRVEKRFAENEDKDFKYICVLEFHKSGLPHYHFLSNHYIPHFVFNKFTKENVNNVYDNTYIVEDAMKKNPDLTEDEVNTNIVANYVTKLSDYLTKSTLETYEESLKDMKKIKLITASQGLKVSDHSSDDEEKKYTSHGFYDVELNANSYIIPHDRLYNVKDFLLERSVTKVDESSLLVREELKRLNIQDENVKHNYIIARRLSQIINAKLYPLFYPTTFNGLSEQQKQAITNFVENKVSVLLGHAGTGKSYTIAALLQSLKLDTDRTFVVSYTGKASTRLKELFSAVGVNHIPTTIHKACSSNFTGDFLRNEKNVLECDYLIIDEVSMIPRHILANLLMAVPTSTRILFAGDDSQLQPINDVSVIRDLLNFSGVAVTNLTHVYRSNDSVLNKAYSVLARQNIVYDLYNDQVLEQLVYSLVNNGYQILTNTKKMTQAINMIVQKGKNEITKCYNDYNYNIGDRVMITANSTPRQVSNGDTGRIVKYDDNSIYIQLDLDQRIVEYRYIDTEQVVPAYAFTVHKSQGSEYEKAALILEDQKQLNTNNLLYTAVTRAKKDFHLYVPTHESFQHLLFNYTQMEHDYTLNNVVERVMFQAI